MKVGMLARAENRGLGTLSLDWYRHMRPDRTLVVIPDAVRHAHLVSHLDRYPDATTIRFDGTLDEKQCREWLDGLDVVYAAETFYDWRFCRWAKEQHVATVCHVMPEWMRPEWAAEPTAWWAPTSWRLDQLPAHTTLVPVPIATDRFTPTERADGPFRWLHVAGAKTHFDRNGTGALLEAARLVKRDQQIVVRTQSHGYAPTANNVTIDMQDVPNYWDLYANADALVMPRRYAGLCLPVLEAIGAGLPVVMTDMAPQNVDWPVETIRTCPAGRVRMMGGRIPTGDADPRDLARVMDEWATDPTTVAEWRTRARDYAQANAWEVRAPEIRNELEHVAALAAA